MKIAQLKKNTNKITNDLEELDKKIVDIEGEIKPQLATVNKLERELKAEKKILNPMLSKDKKRDESQNLRIGLFSTILGILMWIFAGFWWGLTFFFVPFIVLGVINEPLKKSKNPILNSLKTLLKIENTKDENAIKIQESKVKNLQGKVKAAKSKLKKSKSELASLKSKKTEFNNRKKRISSIVSLNKTYDVDDNNELDVAETTPVNLIIKQKQSAIRALEKSENRDYLKDLSKINIFLDSYQAQLVIEFNALQEYGRNNSYNSNLPTDLEIQNFMNDVRTYKALLSSLVLMITHLVNDNLIDYYRLHVIFDKLSIFESNYEKKMIGQLRDMSRLTSQLINATIQSRDEIVSALWDVGYQIDDLKFEMEWMGKK